MKSFQFLRINLFHDTFLILIMGGLKVFVTVLKGHLTILTNAMGFMKSVVLALSL